MKRLITYFLFIVLILTFTLSGCGGGGRNVPVVRTDVYVAGNRFSDMKTIATYWKNGTAVPLSENNSTAYSIFVSGSATSMPQAMIPRDRIPIQRIGGTGPPSISQRITE